jgi:hypothetical protein
VTPDELLAALRQDRIVTLTEAEWNQIAEAWPIRERHDTTLAGDLLILDGPDGPFAVEQPETGRRAVRALEADEVDRFVRDRLATYERMWDGCGCRVDYYA